MSGFFERLEAAYLAKLEECYDFARRRLEQYDDECANDWILCISIARAICALLADNLAFDQSKRHDWRLELQGLVREFTQFLHGEADSDSCPPWSEAEIDDLLDRFYANSSQYYY